MPFTNHIDFVTIKKQQIDSSSEKILNQILIAWFVRGVLFFRVKERFTPYI